MINKLHILESERIKNVITHLDNNKYNLKPDVSNYAKNRNSYWLQYKWNLRERSFTSGIKDKRLWTFCKQWMPDADLGLVVHGSIGINPHRDDSYADWRAVGINLGQIESWYYDCEYPQYRWTKNKNPSNPQNYQISIGQIFEFNCKNLHGVNNPAKDRWAIFLWKISNKFRIQFEQQITR